MNESRKSRPSLRSWLARQTRRRPPAPEWQVIRDGPLAGLELFLPTDADPRSWVVEILEGRYEAPLLRELSAHARLGGSLFDIGSHTGLFGCAWLRLGGSRAELFEPMPDSARRIAETLARNGLGEAATVHELALADFDGEEILVQNRTEIGLASMSYLDRLGGVAKIKRQPGNSRGKVVVRRLDSWMQQQKRALPDVIKIDVEGAEAAVIRGAVETLKRARPTVFCELHAPEPAVEATECLCRLGYRALRVEPPARGMPVYRFDPGAAGRGGGQGS